MFLRLLKILILFSAALFADISMFESDPSVLIEGKVNALTGAPSIYEEDLVIQGVEPIRIFRTYLNDAQGGWRFGVDVAKIIDTEKPYRWIIWEKDRSPILYKKAGNTLFRGQTYMRCEPSDLEKGFSNTARGEISSRTNLRNNRALIDEKFKNLIIQCADGTIRTYKKIHHSDREYQLLSEELPNGNWILYEYDEMRSLLSIRTMNPSKEKTYARADFLYEDPKRKSKNFFVVGSDGQSVRYRFSSKNSEGESAVLQEIFSSSYPDQTLSYMSYRNKFEKFNGNYKGIKLRRIQAISAPLKRAISFDYYKKEFEEIPWGKIHLDQDEWDRGMNEDPRRNRIKTICCPIGESPEPQVVYSFVYDLGSFTSPISKTSVYDVEGCRTDFYPDGQQRLLKIEKFSQEGKRIFAEKYFWEPSGRLLRKTHFDEDLKPVFFTRYIYDQRGNVLEKRFCGNLSGSSPPIATDGYGEPIESGCETYTQKYRYSDSEPNLLIEEEDLNKKIFYRYLPGTDLLLSKFISDKRDIQLRCFYIYNEDRLLVREIEDDGSSTDPDYFSDVTIRKIKDITPFSSGPYLGLPRVIEEKYWEKGKERLLKKTVLTYGVAARIEKEEIFDAEGVLRFCLNYKYDAKGNLIERTNPIGQKESYVYDPCGNLISHKEFSGKIQTRLEYDFSNLPILKSQEADISFQTRYQYDRKKNLVLEKDPQGHPTRYAYDSLNRRIETLFPDGAAFKTEYDSRGNLRLQIDPEGNETRTEYNAYGKPVKIIYPDGAVETFFYELDGKLKIHKDPKGVSTEYEYDFLGNLLSKTTARFFTEKYVYKGKSLVKKIDLEGKAASYVYDGAGRKILEEQNGEKIAFVYDSLGRLSKTINKDLVYVNEYDLLDRIVEERTESLSGKVHRQIAYEYDEAGNQTAIIRSVCDERAYERRTYDAFGRLVEKRDPLGSKETIEYRDFFVNKSGETVLQKIHTDPLGLLTIETFDSRKRVVKKEFFKDKTLLAQEKSYDKNGRLVLEVHKTIDKQVALERSYDARGRLKILLESNSKKTSYDYTIAGELSRLIKPDGVQIFYTYSDLGYLTEISSSDGTVHYKIERDRLGRLTHCNRLFRAYDPKGRLLVETFPRGFAVLNTYNEMGQRKECFIPTADCRIEYLYNPLDLIAVTRKSAYHAPLYTHRYLSYDLSGNLLEEELPLSFGSVFRAVDPLCRKTSISAPSFSQNLLLDPLGNVKTMELQGETSFYTYDDLYQLTSEKEHTYSYDPLNNRTQKDDEFYEIDSLNQIPSHFEYDLNGNVISHGNTRFFYDALDRLIRLETPAFSQVFTYDIFNRRLEEKAFGKTRYFLYDGQNEIGTIDENFLPIELRILGQTPHAEIGSAISIELGRKPYIPIHDLQGNVALLLSSGSAPISYRYTAFGEELSAPSKNPWRFSSKRTDDLTGLVYFGRRFYLPAFGRWLTPDPAGFADGPNLYAYVHNGPLTRIDEYGLLAYHYKNGWESTPWNSPYSWLNPNPPPHPQSQLSPRSLIGIDPRPKFSPHYYVNGMLNTLASSRQGANTLLKTFGSQANIFPIYSESFGFFKDLYTVYRAKRDPGYTSFAVERLNRDVRFNITAMDALQDDRKLFITCFSRGSTDTHHAVKNLTSEQRNRLIITACGPTMVLPRDHGFSVTNLVSRGDWCSFFCNSGLRKNREKYESFADLRILQQKDGFSGFNKDHFFESRTYQEGIREITEPAYKDYGYLK